ncbi:MAG TPA: lipopolysaccharide biosynthesis protein [Saprospiraceae bacterium]|nr:lipopolysaccharide biosynthesis protein [Saprospiraceae bacterium]HMT70853.1 lipopolysaccharide biosynthesis protein [Saprospiraceae bacterium]
MKKYLFWSFSNQFWVIIIQFLTTMYLMRQIDPKDFGIFAVCMSVVSLCNVFLDSGISTSIIRSGLIYDNEYSTIFFYNIFSGSFVASILYFMSSFVASYFDVLIMSTIIKLLCLIIIFRSISIVPESKIYKDLEIKKSSLASITSVLIGSGVAIILAFYNYKIYALVSLVLIQQLTYLFIIFYSTHWIPKLYFNIKLLKIHLNFGWKLSLAGILNSISNEIYNLVIGKHYAISDVAYFNRADYLSKYPLNNIIQPISKIMLPHLAQYQHDNAKLRSEFKDLLQMATFIVYPILTFMIIFSEELLVVLFTDIWRPAASYLMFMCIAGFFYPIHALNLVILKVLGHSDIYLKLDIVKKILLLILILATYKLSIFALLYAYVSISFISIFINTYFTKRLINYGISQQFCDIFKILFVSILVGIFGIILKVVLFVNLDSIINLLFLIFLCGFLYVLTIYYTKTWPKILKID